jgi:hypothetical protein
MPEIVQGRLLEVIFEDIDFDALSLVSSHSMIRLAAMQERA